MGGYGSGGHNKTHRRLENFHRIDSFSFYDYLMGDKYLFCKETYSIMWERKRQKSGRGILIQI